MSQQQTPHLHFEGFDGFNAPRYTQVPDVLFDALLPYLTGAELKVLLYIIRRTFGFKKASDDISLSQMASGIIKRDGDVLDHGAGVSKASAARAVRGLEQKGIIVACRNSSPEEGDLATTYALRFKDADPVSQNKTGVPQNGTGPCLKVRQGGVSELATQETVKQNTVKQEIEDSKLRMGTTPEKQRKKRQNGALTSVGEVLGDRIYPGSGEKQEADYGEERQRVGAVVEYFAREFNDQSKLRSSVSRAYNLWAESGLPIGRFEELLYEARAVTKEWSSQITAAGSDGSGVRRKNKMPYFFSVLEDRVGRAQGKPGRQKLDLTLWDQVKAQLKIQLQQEAFDRFVAGARQTKHEDGTLTIVAPDEQAAEWLDQRLRARIQQALVGLTDDPPVVEFVPLSPPP